MGNRYWVDGYQAMQEELAQRSAEMQAASEKIAAVEQAQGAEALGFKKVRCAAGPPQHATQGMVLHSQHRPMLP